MPIAVYGQLAPVASSGTSFPDPMLTANAVRRVRHHAGYVRSLASRVRRVASPASSKRPPPGGCRSRAGIERETYSALAQQPLDRADLVVERLALTSGRPSSSTVRSAVATRRA